MYNELITVNPTFENGTMKMTSNIENISPNFVVHILSCPRDCMESENYSLFSGFLLNEDVLSLTLMVWLPSNNLLMLGSYTGISRVNFWTVLII